MAVPRVVVGNLLRATWNVTNNVTGVAFNPTTVVARFQAPNGTTYTITHTNPAVGQFVAERVVDQSGWWDVRFEGTGNTNVAGQESVYVLEAVA